MRKFFTKIWILLFLSLILPVTSFAQYDLPVEAYGLNTVAGYTTYLRTSKTTPNTNISFEVTNPDSELINLSAVTNSNGVAQAELSDYHTRKAGTYRVSAKLENNSTISRANTFTVYPGELSETASTVSPSDQVVRSYGEKALITVQLFDKFNNPIEDHLVRLISSANGDKTETYSDSDFSDSNGKVIFRVSSNQQGTAVYSVYDATADKILNSKAKVAYFNSNSFLFENDTPSNYAYAALGNGSLGVDHFEFEDIPSTLNVGDSVTFTITAYDSENQPVVDYTGTIRFAVLSDNAAYVNLPEDYTFTSSDLGTHTFSLAMSFLQPGTYELAVIDIDDSSIFGEQTFVVGDEEPLGPSNGIGITNPVSGTYSNNVQVISGTAPPGSQIKIFDNDVEIASLIADASGNFSYTTSTLVDGMHNIYAATVNEVGTIVATSETVEVNIDTSAPEISNVTFEPSDTVDPGSVVNVKLYTEDELSQATVVFEGNIYEFTENPEGYYETSFSAPIEFGEYPLTFIIVDELGNESRFENYAVLTVGVVSDQVEVPVVGDVTGLKAVPSDHRITLTWNAPAVSTNVIPNYRVYYGLSPNQLTEAVDTFTNSTTWYIPNLKNGVEYYFAVVAVDEKGNISEHFSNIVSAVPNPAVVEAPPPEVELGIAGEEALEEMEKDASESGPEIMWLVLFALLGGVFYGQTSKKRFQVREERHDLFK
ncbi:hypothetical protein GF366_01255 [Candidatus Peregrinibacteria bacterium]|nr:hypothetical protein [Candidatus Peregrinibacteria bacterium]